MSERKLLTTWQPVTRDNLGLLLDLVAVLNDTDESVVNFRPTKDGQGVVYFIEEAS